MRLTQRIRRLVPALLAAVVLLASIAGTAHTHAVAASGVAAVSAGASQATPGASFDLDCALCAAAARLSQGTGLAPARAPDLALARFHGQYAGEVALVGVDLAPRTARAPPRLG